MRSFKSQFRVHIVQPKDVISLTDIKQRDKESLLSYLTRFNIAVAAVKKPDERLPHMAIATEIN